MLSDTGCRHPPTHTETNTNTHIHTQKHALLMWHILFSPLRPHLPNNSNTHAKRRIQFIWCCECTVSVCFILTKCKAVSSSEAVGHSYMPCFICNTMGHERSGSSNYWKNTSSSFREALFPVISEDAFILHHLCGYLWCNLSVASVGPRAPTRVSPPTHPDKVRHIHHRISQQLSAGKAAPENGTLFIWIKIPAHPLESVNAELWHSRSRRPRGERRGSELMILSAAPTTFHIQMSLCQSPRSAP